MSFLLFWKAWFRFLELLLFWLLRSSGVTWTFCCMPDALANASWARSCSLKITIRHPSLFRVKLYLFFSIPHWRFSQRWIQECGNHSTKSFVYKIIPMSFHRNNRISVETGISVLIHAPYMILFFFFFLIRDLICYICPVEMFSVVLLVLSKAISA